LTSCTICPAGTQSGLTGVECTLCTELGLIDEDMDPSTSCTAPMGRLYAPKNAQWDMKI
jgi:hypothetical protein